MDGRKEGGGDTIDYMYTSHVLVLYTHMPLNRAG
jgi:hypothetical protein